MQIHKTTNIYIEMILLCIRDRHVKCGGEEQITNKYTDILWSGDCPPNNITANLVLHLVNWTFISGAPKTVIDKPCVLAK